jgi:hypothetical protein
MRKDGSFIKVERLYEIKKAIIKGLPNPVDIDKLKLWVEMNIGLTPERAQDYIEKVVAASGWVIFEGKILASLPEPDVEEKEKKKK